MVDDIFIGVELPEGVDLNNMKENISFEVYLDGEKINTTQQSNYLFSGLNKGKHKAGVKAVFSSVTTPMTEIEFDVEEGSGIEENQLNGRTISFIINRQKLISLLIECKVKIGGTGITLHRFQINLSIL